MKWFVANASTTAASQTVSTLTTFGLQLLLARTLPTHVFGEFLLAQATITLLEGVLVARSGEVAMYWIGRSWSAPVLARAYANYLVCRELMWNLATYALILALAWPLHLAMGIDPKMLMALGLTIPAQSGYGSSKNVFLAADRIREQAFFEIGYSLLIICIAVPMTLLFGLYGFICAMVASAVLKTIGSRLTTRRYWPEAGRHADSQRPPARALSFHSIFRNSLSNLATQADVLVLGLTGHKDVVAIYKVAKTIATLPGRITGPVWVVLRPRLLHALRDHDFRTLLRLIVKPALTFAALGLLIIPVAGLFAKGFFELLYGARYRESALPFIILLFGTWCFNGITGWLPFLAIVIERKAAVNSLYAMLAVGTILGAIIAGGSASAMAIAVSAALVLVSAFAWIMLRYSSFIVQAAK